MWKRRKGGAIKEEKEIFDISHLCKTSGERASLSDGTPVTRTTCTSVSAAEPSVKVLRIWTSLSLAAAYGTFPFASLLFALLAGLSVWIGRVPGLGWLETNQMAFAFYADALTFVFSAWMISRLTFPKRERRVRTTADDERRVDIKATLQELREGWDEIWKNHTVRAVNLGLATGLIGGGMLIPLGAVFSTEVLDAGAAGYGLFTTALGFGVAIGVVGVSVFQKRLPQTTTFTAQAPPNHLRCRGTACNQRHQHKPTPRRQRHQTRPKRQWMHPLLCTSRRQLAPLYFQRHRLDASISNT
jgi:hypothetical protein